jgi:hypothetical protein
MLIDRLSLGLRLEKSDLVLMSRVKGSLLLRNLEGASKPPSIVESVRWRCDDSQAQTCLRVRSTLLSSDLIFGLAIYFQRTEMYHPFRDGGLEIKPHEDVRTLIVC